jgi:hypothetical protein
MYYTELESRLVVARAGENGELVVTVNGMRLLFGVLKGCTTLWIH